MESRLKHRIFVFSLLVWTVICPSGTQQTHSLREQFLNPSDESRSGGTFTGSETCLLYTSDAADEL